MKHEKLIRAVGEVGDDLIARAQQPAEKKKVVWLRWTALAACCVLIVGAAAFARTLLRGLSSKTTAAENSASYVMEAPRSAPQSAQDFAAEAPEEFSEDAEAETPEAEAPAESAPAPNDAAIPAEEPSEEKLPSDGMDTTAQSAVRTLRFGGMLYIEASSDGAELLPGEALGIVEESDFAELNGCEVCACGDEDPADRILILLDGVYLPFENAERASAD